MKLKEKSIVFTTNQAPGAIPNGTHVCKINSEPGDGHIDGASAKVVGSIGPVDVPGYPVYGYWLEWEDAPGIPVFIAGNRVRESC